MARDYLDRYYTPGWPTHDLLTYHAFYNAVGNPVRNVLDPCAGDCTMARILSKRLGVHVVTGDIDSSSAADFCFNFIDVSTRIIRKMFHATEPDCIITNPPYRITEGPGSTKTKYTLADFARKCLELTPNVALLTRLQWLEDCKDRKDIWRENPPAKILLLPRIEFTDPEGNNVGSGTSMPSIWVIWEYGHTGPTEFIWVDSCKGVENGPVVQ